MKTQHTPGPWKEDKYGCVIDAGGRVVCNEFCTTSIPLAESLANARLIAAAPELLEALENLLRNAYDKARYIAMLEGPEQDIAAAEAKESELDSPEMGRARAALAKAKGEQA